MRNADRSIPISELVAVVREQVEEAYAGPGEGPSWFVEARPDTGVLGTIEGLTAEEASRPARPGGPSIASHVEHLRWSLANVNGTMRGEPWHSDWSESWTVTEVDEGAWDEMRTALRREFEGLREALAAPPSALDGTMLRGAMALPAHAAYHLGAIRQIALRFAS